MLVLGWQEVAKPSIASGLKLLENNVVTEDMTQ